jgi:subtilisin family serine protease
MLMKMRARATLFVALAISLAAAAPTWGKTGWVTVRYTTPIALRGLNVTLRIGALHEAVVVTRDIGALRTRPGIVWARPAVRRASLADAPAFVAMPPPFEPEWQFAATRSNLVPASVERAASKITIAVVDTGADVFAPSLAVKKPLSFSVLSGSHTVTDLIGHGTFVASLAAGSVSQGKVFTGFGGDARLMIVQASGTLYGFNDASEAAAIVWAVDHGARIVNLSLGGFQTSQVEQDAVDYAARHGVLLVAAAGNDGTGGNTPVYPAALLVEGGLAVGASTRNGSRASFSPVASYVALAAPGVHVLGAIASTSSASTYPRVSLPGVTKGFYGYGSGTSYAAPEVSGAAALVWAANPRLTAREVIHVLEATASNAGSRSPGLGYGVIDVAGAVAMALGRPAPAVTNTTPTIVTVQASQPRLPAASRRNDLKEKAKAG